MADIGSTLRETRMRKRIDISEVEAATKIRARYLRALENEEWSLLPGPTFVKTFLRTYAEYLEIDARLLVEEYRDLYEQPTASELAPSFQSNLGNPRDPRRPPPRRPPPLALGAIGLVGLLLVILVLGLTAGDDGDDKGTRAGETTTTETASASERRAAERRRERAERERRSRARKRTAARERLTVRLTATQPVAVCLVDRKTGRTLMDNRVVDPTTEPRSYRGRQLRAWFGNGGLTLRVGSKTLEVPDRTTVAGYRISRTALTPLPESQRSPCAA